MKTIQLTEEELKTAKNGLMIIASALSSTEPEEGVVPFEQVAKDLRNACNSMAEDEMEKCAKEAHEIIREARERLSDKAPKTAPADCSEPQWRDMEEGETLEKGDQVLVSRPDDWRETLNVGLTVGKSTMGLRYRTKRPQPPKHQPFNGAVAMAALWPDGSSQTIASFCDEEPPLALPDGTNISEWPEIQVGEMVYEGDAIMHEEFTNGKWVESNDYSLGACKPDKHPYSRPHGVNWHYLRRILECRHCGSEAYYDELHQNWECVFGGCFQSGPNADESGVKWNEQNGKDHRS